MKQLDWKTTLLKITAVVLVTALAWSLRLQAANTLSIDYDEDDYLRAGQEFAHLIRNSNWQGFLETNYRPEHPALSKIMYGLSLLGLPEEPLIEDVSITAPPATSLPPVLLKSARAMAAGWGALTVALTAIINPLGGLLLAIHTFNIKYTSEVMLDGFPALMSTATALAYYLSKRTNGKVKASLLVISAVCLGISVSGKYMHFIVGVAILIDWWLVARKNQGMGTYLREAFLWGLLAIGIFLLLNPFFWSNPVEKVQLTLEAVTGTRTNPNVKSANFPVWQPIVWLSMSPATWQEGVFIFKSDLLITILALLGLGRIWKKEPFIAIWLLAGMFILLVWTTKWPQYILVLTAPLSLAAGEALSLGWENIKASLSRLGRKKEAEHFNRREVLQSIPWLVPGLVIFAVFTLYPILYQVAMSFTDFNSIAIKDGMNGGVWREFWGGISGQIEAVRPDFPFRSKEVQFTGPSSYLPVSDLATSEGILAFNLIWTVLSMTLQTMLGIGAALLLWNKRIRFRRGWQTLFILPWAIPETIGALMWLTVFVSPFGWIALATQDLGPDIPLAFFNGWERSPNLTMLVLLIANTWYGFPFMMLAATAGLKQVPTEVFDASAIDGANAWQTFRNVTLPLLAPLVVPAVLIRGIFAFNQFYLIQIFGFLHGNFSMTTLATLSFNIFNPSGFFGANGQFAISAALNIITLVILVGFVTILNRLTKADEGVTYA